MRGPIESLKAFMERQERMVPVSDLKVGDKVVRHGREYRIAFLEHRTGWNGHEVKVVLSNGFADVEPPFYVPENYKLEVPHA